MAGISKRRVYAWLEQFNESDLIEDDRHIDIFYGKTDSRQWFTQILELYDFIKEVVEEKGYGFNVGYCVSLNMSLRKSPAPARISGNSLRTAPFPPLIYLYRHDKHDIVWKNTTYEVALSRLYGMDVYYYQSDDKDGRWRMLKFL